MNNRMLDRSIDTEKYKHYDTQHPIPAFVAKIQPQINPNKCLILIFYSIWPLFNMCRHVTLNLTFNTDCITEGKTRQALNKQLDNNKENMAAHSGIQAAL